VARERATGHPILPGTSVKGVLRAASRDRFDGGQEKRDSRTWGLFGPDASSAHEHTSAVRVSDARLLLLPAQSDRGVFAWVTCPFAIDRLRRDAGDLKLKLPRKALPLLREGECRLGALGTLDSRGRGGAQAVTLGGLQFTVVGEESALADALAGLVFPPSDRHVLAWSDMLKRRLAVVDDDTFTAFAENHTEVRARIRLDPSTRTVARGGLWYEEALPAESVLAGLIQVVDNGKGVFDTAWKSLETITAELVQLGGNASTGQGVARVRLHGGGR